MYPMPGPTGPSATALTWGECEPTTTTSSAGLLASRLGYAEPLIREGKLTDTRMRADVSNLVSALVALVVGGRHKASERVLAWLCGGQRAALFAQCRVAQFSGLLSGFSGLLSGWTTSTSQCALRATPWLTLPR
jgi:hypothetical protein